MGRDKTERQARQPDRNQEKKVRQKPRKESGKGFRLVSFLILFLSFFLKMLFQLLFIVIYIRGKDAPFGAGRRTIWCVKAHHLVRALIRFYAPFGACLRHASACFCVLLAHFLGRFSGGKKGNRHRRMDAPSVKDKGQRGESVRRKKVLA